MNKEPGCNYCQHPEHYGAGEVSRHTHTTRTSLDVVSEETAARIELYGTVRVLDGYEATIALAYVKRLIKSRETR